MKLAALAFTTLLLAPAAANAKDRCTDATDQATLNQCADTSYKQSDKKLNALYAQIEKRLGSDKDTKALLIQAQRNWIKFRDTECDFQTSAVGGSMLPMLLSMCMDDLTKARIRNFDQYLHCQEGDTSCPVPPSN